MSRRRTRRYRPSSPKPCAQSASPRARHSRARHASDRIASFTSARTPSARRRTESVTSFSIASSSGLRGVEFGATGLGDLVDGLAAVGRLRDEALFLELRQARVDRAGARAVRAAEAVAQRLDELVPVARLLVEQGEQVEAQAAVGEDRRGHADASAPAAARGSRAVVVGTARGIRSFVRRDLATHDRDRTRDAVRPEVEPAARELAGDALEALAEHALDGGVVEQHLAGHRVDAVAGARRRRRSAR